MEYEPCLHNGKRPSVKKTSGPDGLEAWLVALAACFINFVIAGLGRMTGILFVALIDIFHTDRKQASLPSSIRSSTRNLLGPVVGILGQKYGIRPVIIVGGIIGTISAASCFYINDIIWITVVWGGINGVGTALTTTLPQVVIGQHFQKYRATASGMAFSGGCVGSFIFPALIEYFLDRYDIGGTFLLIAGFIMHVIPAALILKTPSWWKDENGPDIQIQTGTCETEKITNVSTFQDENKDRETGVQSVDENVPRTDDSFTKSSETVFDLPVNYEQNSVREQSFKNNIDSEFLWQNRDILITLLTNNLTLQYQQSEMKCNIIFPTDNAFIKDLELLLRNLEIKGSAGDIDLVNAPSSPLIPEAEHAESKIVYFTNGNIKSGEVNGDINIISVNYTAYYLKNLFERDKTDMLQNVPDEQQENVKKILEDLEKLHNQLTSYGNNSSQLTNNSEFVKSGTNRIENNAGHSNSFCSHIKTALKLYTKPLFLLICLCRAVHFLTFIPAVTIIVDYSMDKGLPSKDGKYAIAALSAGDLVGRLCFGWITDRGYVTLPKYMLSVMILQGVATVTFPLMQSRAAIMASIAMFGLLQGSIFVRHPVLISRYLGNHEQSIAMGCINFFSGILGFILPIYIGFFRDTVGSYDGLFYINGSLGSFIGLLWVFEPYCLKLSSISVPSENQPSQV